MSLFGTSPTEEHNEPSTPSRQTPRSRRGGGLFNDSPSNKASSNGLFDDGDAGEQDSSPWNMPTPRKQQSRAELIRNLLPASDVPDSYIETFDAVVREDGSSGRATASCIAKLFANARLGPQAQTRIMSLVAPGDGSDVSLGRNEFNVLLALVGLAQEGDIISLDGVDERRRSKLHVSFLFSSVLHSLGTFPCTTQPLRVHGLFFSESRPPLSSCCIVQNMSA
jgi:sorting nexin-8